MESTESNTRIRQFFGFDPIEFVDDVVCSTSYYINGLKESLSSLLSSESISQNKQNEIKSKLFTALQSSIDLNSDIFEMYLMRNIFHIPVDVDLTSELSSSSKIAGNMDSLSSESMINEADEDELDSELEGLYAEIRNEQNVQQELWDKISSKRIMIQQTNEIVKRTDMIDEILRNAGEIPVQQIDELLENLQSTFQKAKTFHSNIEENKLLYHQSSFTFD